jgi:signal transduction histidine kinase
MMCRMQARAQGTAGQAASGLWAVTALIGVAGAVLTLVAWQDLRPGDAYGNLGGTVASLVYATLGVLIVRRVGNRIGWMLVGVGLGLAILSLTDAYAVVGAVTHPGVLPAAKPVGTLAEWIFVPIVIGLAYVLLVFPTGALPSPRWRPISTAAIAITALALVGFIVTPRQVALPAPGGVSLTFPNPFAIRSLGHGISTVLVGTLPSLTLFSVLLYVAAVVALVVRYRSGGPFLRQQIKWVAFAAVAAAACQAALVLAQVAAGFESPVTIIVGLAAALAALFGIPIAITIAILKHGLYEIDVIIKRTVVYGLLAAAATAVYVVVVVGIGSLVGYGVGSPVLTAAAAVAITLLFQPLRRQAQRVANRLVYGERASPYQVLSDFAENMAGTLALDDVLDRMVSVLADGTGATRADVWIRVGQELRPVATWPRDAARPEALAMDRSGELQTLDGATSAVAVRQGDEMLGALAIQKSRNEPLSMTEEKLLTDLASQAGLVLRNVRLTAELRATIQELRASRRRLVGAQDAERRKIERNLHDGAQQQLVALKVQLGLLGRVAADPDQVGRMAHQLQDALQGALDDLRDLARGIYPPLLADQGLVAALQAQARKASVPTVVRSDGVGRYPQDTEAAVYFCVLEALTNVAKYSGATKAEVRLEQTNGELRLDVTDDGSGFDTVEMTYGTGLQGMADRLDAIGGTLSVASTPGEGTTIEGRIPTRDLLPRDV